MKASARAILAMAICTVGSGSASGQLNYTTNPNACEIAGASASTNAYFGGGGIVQNNNSSGGATVTLVCPLFSTQNETATPANQNKPDLLKIEIVDDYNSSDLSCQLTGWRIDAGSGNRLQDYDIYNPTSGVPANQDSSYWYSIEWDSTPGSAGSVSQWGINCTIPPKDASGNASKIGMISIEEG